MTWGEIISIVLSVVAIVLSYWFFKDAHRASGEASITLLEVKNTEETVKHNVQNITAQLLHSVLHRQDDERWKNEMCCSNNEVIASERKVRPSGKIYVSVVTMDYEVSQFIQVIADNLKHGKQYYYFLPLDILGGYDGEMQKFVTALLELEGVPQETLMSNLSIMTVPSGEILCNITLLDPGIGADEGYILPAYDNAERAFSVRLDHTLYMRAWNRVQEWIRAEGSSSTKIWPPRT